MQNFDNEHLPKDVKERIDEILAKHKIATESISHKKSETEYVEPLIDSNPNQSQIAFDREIKLDPAKTIMSKTDARGVIEYANDYFMEICGYEEYELMGKPHNIIRHPDMPKVIFKLLWERLHQGKNIHALVKNLAKDGRYYWVLTNFETKYDEDGKIISHYARRKAAPGNAIYQIEKLYKTLLSIEKNQSPETAEKYFYGLLEEKGLSYDDFILDVLDITPDALKNYFMDENSRMKTEKKKGFFEKLFK